MKRSQKIAAAGLTIAAVIVGPAWIALPFLPWWLVGIAWLTIGGALTQRWLQDEANRRIVDDL